jgi:hypothetical protein
MGTREKYGLAKWNIIGHAIRIKEGWVLRFLN